MLYPSLSKERCFSTTYMERGGHSGKDGKDEATASSSLRQVTTASPLHVHACTASSSLRQVTTASPLHVHACIASSSLLFV